MDFPPPVVRQREVVISGITFDLAGRPERPLLVHLSVDGTDSPPALLGKKRQQTGNVLLKKSLNLRDGSVLSIKVYEKQTFRSDKLLAQLNLSLEDVWPMQERIVAGEQPKKYQVPWPDSNKKIWLTIADLGRKNTIQDALQKLQDFPGYLGRLGPARGPLDNILRIAKAVAELHPILKTVVAGVTTIYNELETQDQHREDLLGLAESIDDIIKSISSVEGVARSKELKYLIESFPNLMNETADFIRQWLSRRKLKFLNASGNKRKIKGLKEEFARFERAFDRGVAGDSAIKINYLTKAQELEELRTRLGGIVEVKPKADECFEGTRIGILSSIEDEIRPPNIQATGEDKNTIWICGAPGSGKSSLSLTLKSRLQKAGRWVIYSRFDRTIATPTSALWCRVAYELADRYPSVLEHHLSLLRNNQVSLTSPAEVFTNFVEGPLSKLTEPHPDHPLTLIIDGLDECGGNDGRFSSDRRALLATLDRWHKLPKHFILLATSRDEEDIRKILSPKSTIVQISSGNTLADNPESLDSINASNDICIFLEYRLQDIRRRFESSISGAWPGNETIDDMVKRAAGNFMWAVAATNHVERSLDPVKELGIIMRPTSQSNGMEPLYTLYLTILESSFGNNDSDTETVRAVLGAMICAARPLSDEELTKLPTRNPINLIVLQSIRNHLGSVIITGGNLRFVHKSVDDFLLSDVCPEKYRVRQNESQCLLTRLCLATMKAELRFNMCNLETSCLWNMDVPNIENKIRNGISDLLQYSCILWANHLRCTPFNDELMQEVKEMIYDKFLFWLEAMSLLRNVLQVLGALMLVLEWLEPSFDEHFSDFLRDAYRFIGTFGQVISGSAPHIYISALPFAPEQSLVAQHFLPRFPRTLALDTGKSISWSSCAFTFPSHLRAPVRLVAFSPNTRHFVSSSNNNTSIFNSSTGNPFASVDRAKNSLSQTLMGDSAQSIFFDLDGRRMWTDFQDGEVISWDVHTRSRLLAIRHMGRALCCRCVNGSSHVMTLSKPDSGWGTITVWSAETGERLGNLPAIQFGYDSFPEHIACSPDGGYIAWTGTDDTAIRTLNLVHGREIQPPVESQGHKERISNLSFSVDEIYVASGSEDGTILVWDVEIGQVIGPPLVTGVRPVMAVAYSHTKKLLISALYGSPSVMVWNSLTHELILGPLAGHTAWILSVSLSRSGRMALSGSVDGTVKMWILDGKRVSHGTQATVGHTSIVACVIFSACGKRLASSSYDNTARVWDVITGEQLLGPIKVNFLLKNNEYITYVVFSPDGSRVIISDKCTLQVWSVETGECVLHQYLDDGRYNPGRRPLAFRSTDHRLLTCSGGTLCVWHLGKDVITEDRFVSSPDPAVTSNTFTSIVALAPDGLTALVVTSDVNMKSSFYLWNTTTHQSLPLTPILGEKKHLVSAFSPSGGLLAISFRDQQEGYEVHSLHVFDTQTGQPIAELPMPEDHRLSPCLAFSPDECHIAFAYLQGWGTNPTTSVWTWNFITHHLSSQDLSGHTYHVTALAFSVDGKKLASGSSDCHIRIWDTADLAGNSQAPFGAVHDMYRGWVIGENGELLFWVPDDHRVKLLRGRCITVIGTSGIPTQLDTKKFVYGDKWAECYNLDK